LLGDPGSKFLCEKLGKAGKKKKGQRRRKKERGKKKKERDGIQTAELDRRDQVTVPNSLAQLPF
jgi:hypothetical protein